MAGRIDHERAAALYTTGMSANAVATQLGCSTGGVLYALKTLGVKARDGNRKWYFDQRFFQHIDSEEKSYWLGFFVADGCVTGNQLSIGLASCDSGHLEKFKKALKLEAPVVTKEMTKYGGGTPRKDGKVTRVFNSRVTFGSVAMVRDLATLHVIQNKRRKEKAPLEAIPRELRRHFWRGVIDGDGYVSNRAGKRAVVTLTCSYTLCAQFRDFVLGEVGAVKADVRKHETSFAFTVGQQAAACRLLEVLYSGAGVYLDRKYVAAHEGGFTPSYKMTPRPTAHFTFEEAQAIRRRVEAGEQQTAVARAEGVSPSAIAGIVKWRTYKAPVGQRYVDGVGRLQPTRDTKATRHDPGTSASW